MTKTAAAIAIHFALLACLFALLASRKKAEMLERAEAGPFARLRFRPAAPSV